MTLRENLIKARSHLVFIAALICAFALAFSLEQIEGSAGTIVRTKSMIVPSRNVPALPVGRALEDWEQDAAEIAWTYFQRNYRPETGLVNSVDQYPAATLWDTSSYMMALISAHRLELITQTVFDRRLSKLLDSLGKMDLHDGQLPNKSYNTRTLAMVDYTNRKTERGIGWSAIDINYPHHTTALSAVIRQWDFDALISGGEMIGARVGTDGQTEYVQEGRLGYEEYASKSLTLLGKDVNLAFSYEDNLKFEEIYGLKVATDSRDPEIFNAHNYVVSEPYILDGIEYGWDAKSAELAWRVYNAQKRRFEETGILTAVSEDNIDTAPYFVYNTVYTSGKSWNAITEDGEDASEFKSLSTKAVIGWHMLYNDQYTRRLVTEIKGNYDPEKGWYSGIYELTGKPNKAITANTNGIILEALAFAKFGKHMQVFGSDS